MSRWAHVTEAPPDPILGVSVAFKADPVSRRPLMPRFTPTRLVGRTNLA